MRLEHVTWLCCPLCKADLKLSAQTATEEPHVMEGRLSCTACGADYPIERGVPNMLPDNGAQIAGDDLAELQQQTVDRFGFEWLHYAEWGWYETYPDVPNAEQKFYGGLIENTRQAFWNKSLLTPEEMAGAHVLDGGCGNGRFTYQAASAGARVVGIDLGWGVFSAFRHTRDLPDVLIVRGDLFRLPFRPGFFDRVFSIGVLMHTGNAGAAFDSLAATVKPGGRIVGHVYGKGLLSYEIIDATIRAVTVRLPKSAQMTFARATAALSRLLRRWPRLNAWIYRHINLLPTDHHMYDWWAAPIATHHTVDEVKGWLDRNGLKVISSQPPIGDTATDGVRRRTHSTITMLGERPL